MCCGRLSSAISNSEEKNGNLFDALRMKLKACLRLPAMGTLKRYSKALEYEYRVKNAALGTLK
jgi:hypothetical protein